jgi:amidase
VCLDSYPGVQTEPVDVGAQGSARRRLPRHRASQRQHLLASTRPEGDAVGDRRRLQRPQRARLLAIGIRLGLPTTWGMEAFRDHVAARTAVAVQRLLDAGAVVYGKTNVPTALADWQSFNPIHGTCGNPWDTRRTPGGSSGGAAAALAAGLTPLALGSDIGSSIRNPAHYCGVWGHKPTWGVVPLEGHQLPGDVCPDSTDIAVAGPLARSAHDLSLAMDVLASPLSVFGPLGRTPAVWRDHRLPARQLRVAVMTDDAQAPVDATVRQAMEQLVDFLRRSGVTVSTEARLVDSQQAWRLYIPLVRSALAGHLSEAEFAQALQRAEAGPGAPTDFPRLH